MVHFLILLGIIAAIIVHTKSSTMKGIKGERQVARVTKHCYRDSDRILYNLYLPWNNGSTAEIDELVISKSGIYVFEVKNYSGWIFGNQRDECWTQDLPKGYSGKSEKNRFLNPIIQNDYHIRCLKNIIGKYNNVSIHSIIVFSDKCAFKNIAYDSNCTSIIHRKELRHYLSSIRASYEDALDQDEIDSIYNMLRSSSVNGKEVKSQHIKAIKERHSEDEYSKRMDMICPICGSRLVLRTAKQGKHAGSQFYGCSSFPNCRYTRRI